MGKLFLPFTPAGKKTELTAMEVKEQLGVGPYQPVDPFEVLSEIPARLVGEADLLRVDLGIQRTLLGTASGEWSAVSFRSPSGEEWIVLNPNHHPHRQRATLMEEITHIVRKHPRVRLGFDQEGTWRRPFNAAVEDEAFNVGAACMIPYRWLFRAINDRFFTARDVAKQFSVSVDYAKFRIKRSGLYNVYRKRQRAMISK